MKQALEDWITPAHLGEDAIAAAARRYADDPYHTVWFDDFLLPGRLEALRGLYREDGQFAPWLGLYDETSHNGLRCVKDMSEFEAAPDAQRFEIETVMTGPKPDRRLSPGYLTHLAFSGLIASERFRFFIERITGVATNAVNRIQVRITEPGHYVRRHTDLNPRRRLCLVFYPAPTWTPCVGGRFLQFGDAEGDSPARALEPLPNRLVAFQVSDRSWHEVEPMAAGAGPRWGYSIWLGESAQTS